MSKEILQEGNDRDSAQKDSQDRQEVATAQKADRIAKNSHHPSEEGKERDDDKWERILALTNVVLSAVVAITAVVGSWFVYRQLRLMNESNALTRESIQFAKKTAADSDATTQKALEIANRSAQAAENAADLAKQQMRVSERSLGVTESSIKNRERPWIFATDVRGSPNFSAPFRTTVGIQFKNLGALPASRMVVLVRSRISSEWFPQDPSPPPNLIIRSAGVLGPGEAVTADAILEEDTLNVATAKLVTEGKATLYIYGWLQYSDQASRPHMLRFCRYYLPSGGDRPWAHCRHHNDTN